MDLEPGVWTKYRIVIDGIKARLFVHRAAQPCLIVNDIKFGDSEGAVALFVAPGTEGYFAKLEITQYAPSPASCARARTAYWQFAGKSEVIHFDEKRAA